jgi:hypothetical protein
MSTKNKCVLFKIKHLFWDPDCMQQQQSYFTARPK